MGLTLADVLEIHKNRRMDKEIWETVVNYLGKFVDTADTKAAEGINVAGLGIVPQERITGIMDEIRETHIHPITDELETLNETPVELESGKQTKKAKDKEKADEEGDTAEGSSSGKKAASKIHRRVGKPAAKH